MIKNLVFDFGKVLVAYDFKRVVRKFFDNQEDFELYYSTYVTEEFLGKCDKEDKPVREIFREAGEKDPRFARELMMFHDSYQEFVIGEVPGMRELLERYKKQGYKLYGITNWCSPVYKVMERFEIFNLLDGRLLSCEEHLIKPYPEIYLRFLEKFGLKAEECVFADDKAPNIIGARNVGMYGIVFENSSQYEEDLKKLLASD